MTESAPGDLAAVLRDQVAAARAVHLMFTGALRAWTPGTGLPASVRLLTHDVRRYDGAPFTGRPPGEVGPHGALSSVEALVVDDAALDAAYGGRTRVHATITHELIPLTCNEIRQLFINLPSRARNGIHHLLRWSRWRRRHQARARVSHYRRREATPP